MLTVWVLVRYTERWRSPMPVDATLKRTENALVFKVIQNHHFEPAEFYWQETEQETFCGPNYTVSQLIHRSTGYYFVFGHATVSFSPGSLRKVEAKEHGDSWRIKGPQLKEWLERLREEVQTPDLWAEIAKERALSDAASSMVENQRFTVTEQQQIAGALVELKQYLLAAKETDEKQRIFIDRQFKYLEGSSRRLGRKDWLTILYGLLASTVITLALPPENVKNILQMAGTMLHWLWEGTRAIGGTPL
jgi:hypothetical protein